MGFLQLAESLLRESADLETASLGPTHDHLGMWVDSIPSTPGLREDGVGQDDRTELFVLTFPAGMQRAGKLSLTGQPVPWTSHLPGHVTLCPSCSQSFRKCSALWKYCPSNLILPLTIAFLPVWSYCCLACPMTIFSRKQALSKHTALHQAGKCCIISGGCQHLGGNNFLSSLWVSLSPTLVKLTAASFRQEECSRVKGKAAVTRAQIKHSEWELNFSYLASGCMFLIYFSEFISFLSERR